MWLLSNTYLNNLKYIYISWDQSSKSCFQQYLRFGIVVVASFHAYNLKNMVDESSYRKDHRMWAKIHSAIIQYLKSLAFIFSIDHVFQN
jgi:hypothetical protein